MKIISASAIVLMFVALVLACSKESAAPSPAQTNGINLAGASGSSKSWKLTSLTYTLNGGVANTVTLDPCVLDNIYQFTNNPTQDFIQTEGAIKCNSADSTVTESGNWALTNDGKNLVVEGQWFDDLSKETVYQYIFTAFGEASVTQITATTFVISYSFTNSSGKYNVTSTFTKI
jgi:hypothetical protein